MAMSREEFNETLVPSLLTEDEQACLLSLPSAIQDHFYEMHAKGKHKDEDFYFSVRHAKYLVENCFDESVPVAHKVILLALKTTERLRNESSPIVRAKPLDEVMYLSLMSLFGWVKYASERDCAFDADDSQWVSRSAAVLTYLDRFHGIVPWDQSSSFYSIQEDYYTDQWGCEFKCLSMESSVLQEILFNAPELCSQIESLVDERELTNSEKDVNFIKEYFLENSGSPAISDGYL